MLGPRRGTRTSYSPQQAGWQTTWRDLNLGVRFTVRVALGGHQVTHLYQERTLSGQWVELVLEPSDGSETL